LTFSDLATVITQLEEFYNRDQRAFVDNAACGYCFPCG
jgi:hypothetical protein